MNGKSEAANHENATIFVMHDNGSGGATVEHHHMHYMFRSFYIFVR